MARRQLKTRTKWVGIKPDDRRMDVKTFDWIGNIMMTRQ